nr:hypothetical protein [Bacillus pumilus]
MKHKNDEQKKQIATVTKKLKKEKKAYEKEVKQRKALEIKVDPTSKRADGSKSHCSSK